MDLFVKKITQNVQTCTGNVQGIFRNVHINVRRHTHKRAHVCTCQNRQSSAQLAETFWSLTMARNGQLCVRILQLVAHACVFILHIVAHACVFILQLVAHMFLCRIIRPYLYYFRETRKLRNRRNRG